MTNKTITFDLNADTAQLLLSAFLDHAYYREALYEGKDPEAADAWAATRDVWLRGLGLPALDEIFRIANPAPPEKEYIAFREDLE